jgi:hypothetical protein
MAHREALFHHLPAHSVSIGAYGNKLSGSNLIMPLPMRNRGALAGGLYPIR